jgi:hypothetical protein
MRFDPLADGRGMGPCSAFLVAARSRERGVRFGDLGREAVAGVAAVAEQDRAAAALAAVRQDQADRSLVGVRRAERLAVSRLRAHSSGVESISSGSS